MGATSAMDPVPQVGQAADGDNTVLSWVPGERALRSEVYLGTNSVSVVNARRLPGDVDGDGLADMLDLSVVAAQWLAASLDPCPDMDYSGRVDLPDLAALSRDWGGCADVVYLGATSGSMFDPGLLKANTTYYWRVDSVRCDGIERGTVWNFKTKLPAFPGAEGFGKWASGGRGGSVYHVTNLNDSGTGSFRDAVSQANRAVVFNVGGVIKIGERIIVSKDITIAGQTAPGEGVTLYGNGLSYTDANRSITRYMRYRMGVGGTSGKDAIALADGTNMIFDHCSIAWGRDENFSISGGTGEDPGLVTIQDCIIAMGLETHSCGGLIQDFNGVSLFRNLYIDNDTRNPKVKGINDFTNNVVYNWDDAAYILGDSEADSYANVCDNYFISGPNTGAAAFTRGNLNFHIYARNNWHDSNRNGLLDGAVLAQSGYGAVDWQTVPYNYSSVRSLMSPLAAVKFVASRAGASYPVRDKIDTRLVKELMTFGTSGQLISNENNSPIYGIGTLDNGICPTDTDQDGMPDYWESSIAGLNLNVADNNGDINTNGYTNLEEYLNWLGGSHADVQKNSPAKIDLRVFNSGFNAGAAYTVLNVTHGTAVMEADGYTLRFTPDTNYVGLAELTYTVNDGSSITDTVSLLVSAYGGHPLPPIYPTGLVNGLDYAYYEGSWDFLPDFSALTPERQGTSAGFDISTASVEDGFAFVFEGFIDIPTSGPYTFYTHSDDGSKLYIDGGIVVSNDGVHGSQERSGRAALLAGKHTIRVTFFEKTGGQRLEVRWAGPDFDRQLMPNTVLYRGSLDTTAPAVPTGLWAAAASGMVSLDWADNPDADLAGYNIYRTTVSGSTYTQLNTTLLTSSNDTDTGLANGTLYHYTITAVDTAQNESNKTSEVSAAPAATASVIMQENTAGFCSVDGTVDSNNAGFTGDGFANGNNATAAGVNWKVSVPSVGNYALTWRFANGTTTDRPANLLVDGATAVSGISFVGTGAWTTWTTLSQAVTLTAGTHTIRLEPTTSNGLANIDYLMIAGAGVVPIACN
ncbi:MAG: PA14 domain-containing protein [Anaerohalosphaeraceae bacterium]